MRSPKLAKRWSTVAKATRSSSTLFVASWNAVSLRGASVCKSSKSPDITCSCSEAALNSCSALRWAWAASVSCVVQRSSCACRSCVCCCKRKRDSCTYLICDSTWLTSELVWYKSPWAKETLSCKAYCRVRIVSSSVSACRNFAVCSSNCTCESRIELAWRSCSLPASVWRTNQSSCCCAFISVCNWLWRSATVAWFSKRVNCKSSSRKISCTRTKFSWVSSKRAAVSLRRSLYLETPAASSRKTRSSSGFDSKIREMVPWPIMA